jgi:hypothetical protein
LSPVLSLRILTPKFFAYVLTHHSLDSLLSDSLLDPAVENRTAHVDEPETLIRLVRRAAENEIKCAPVAAKGEGEGEGRKGGSRAAKLLAWMVLGLLTLVRRWQLITGGVYPSRGLPKLRAAEVTEPRENVGAREDNGKGPYFLDEFVLQHDGALEQAKYVTAGVMAAVREMIVGTVGGA